jgi:seryl-tRNA synthetase
MTLKVSNHTFVCEGKNMQRFLWVLLLMTSTCYAEVNQTGPYIVKSLQKQVENLTAENQQLKQQLADKNKEIELLKALCRKNNIDTNSLEQPNSVIDKVNKQDVNSKSTESIVYRGHERTKEWFERMYERFSDKIALAGDEFVYLRTFKPNQLSADFVEVGTMVRLMDQGKVVSVIGDREALIMEPGGRFMLHISDYNYPLIDGQSFYPGSPTYLICVGTYKYTAVLNAQKTVQSFKVWQPEPLTREQFAEAISSGIELVEFVEKEGKTIRRPIR